MKIKQKKQVNLPQLIEWAWEEGITGDFVSSNQEDITVEIENGLVATDYGSCYPNSKTRFEIEEEVEIDEDTKLNFIAINRNNLFYIHSKFSINDRLDSNVHAWYGTKFIYLQNEDGSIGELIWKDGEMVE